MCLPYVPARYACLMSLCATGVGAHSPLAPLRRCKAVLSAAEGQRRAPSPDAARQATDELPEHARGHISGAGESSAPTTGVFVFAPRRRQSVAGHACVSCLSMAMHGARSVTRATGALARITDALAQLAGRSSRSKAHRLLTCRPASVQGAGFRVCAWGCRLLM